MITICTMMWKLRTSVIFPKALKDLQLRHNVADLKQVDLLLIYGGGSNYSAVGKCPGRCHRFSGRYHGDAGWCHSFSGWGDGLTVYESQPIFGSVTCIKRVVVVVSRVGTVINRVIHVYFCSSC